MKLLITKSDWELAELPLDAFIQRVADVGYDGTEIYLPARTDPVADIRKLHAAADLKMIAHIATSGPTAEDHLRSLESHYLRAIELEPLSVNCHTGCDHFTVEDNVRIFEKGLLLVERHGVPLNHETHRGRALFSVPSSKTFLHALPTLRLTADFSHWVNVHESTLADQVEDVERAMQAVDHIHARVGFDQGPQLSDPRNPVHSAWLKLFASWWDRIICARRHEGREWFTISPEFGPPPYMPLDGRTQKPVADAWEVNLWMKDYLRKNWSGSGG